MPAISTENGSTYAHWRNEINEHIQRGAVSRVPGLVSLRVTGSDDDRGRNWAALLAPLLQALSDLGIIDGPGLAGRVQLDWSTEALRGSLHVAIRQLSSPATRHRIVSNRGPRQAAGAAA